MHIHSVLPDNIYFYSEFKFIYLSVYTETNDQQQIRLNAYILEVFSIYY